ncbi:MAG: phage tail tube protein, partial [Rectinema sp.]
PTPAANALLVWDVDVKPAGEAIQRPFVKSTLSQAPFIRGVRSVQVSCKSELKGSGTKGGLPTFGWEGALFRACGMSETVTASTSIVYAPVSSGFESVTLYVYKDGLCHKILGCRGTFRLSLEVGQYPVLEWTFYGLYAAPTDTTPGAQTFSTVKPNPILGAGLSIGGYSPVATKLELDLNNTVTPRKSLNSPAGIVGFEITGRSPQGSFDPEATTEATNPFWAKWEAADALALAVGPIGATAGNIINIGAPKLQYRELSYGDRDGTLTYTIPFALAMNAGDDELTITLT